jgi:hypothetical protein
VIGNRKHACAVFAVLVLTAALAVARTQRGGGGGSSYPIPAQSGIYPPEAGGWNLGDLPPAGQGITSATGWAFFQSNIHDARTPTVDVQYLAVKALVNGQTVTIVQDTYGTTAGRSQQVWGDGVPRDNYTDPSLEIPGTIVSG